MKIVKQPLITKKYGTDTIIYPVTVNSAVTDESGTPLSKTLTTINNKLDIGVYVSDRKDTGEIIEHIPTDSDTLNGKSYQDIISQSKEYVDEKITALTNTNPETIETIKELIEIIKNSDQSSLDTLVESLSTKANIAELTKTNDSIGMIDNLKTSYKTSLVDAINELVSVVSDIKTRYLQLLGGKINGSLEVTNEIHGELVGNASSADKATYDENDENIASTYLHNLSLTNNKLIKTYGDGSVVDETVLRTIVGDFDFNELTVTGSYHIKSIVGKNQPCAYHGTLFVLAESPSETSQIFITNNLSNWYFRSIDLTNNKFGSWEKIETGNDIYQDGNGIKIDNNIITNSGVLSITKGEHNGAIRVNTDGILSDVYVKGLNSAAFTSIDDYAASEHNHCANNITSGTFSDTDVRAKNGTDYDVFRLRNIAMGTTDIGTGSELNDGDVYIVYE